MAKTVGIIAEYNPFHNGHYYHLQKAKQEAEADFCVAVISGNFTQRGETSIVNKWAKAYMAICGGADLVIELPTLYSVSSAENFANGAIKILDSLKIVDSFAFGAEADDLATLNNIANVLYNEPRGYTNILSHELKKGISYPMARENALMMYLNDIKRYANVLGSPNNILAIEYLKALKTQKSHLEPIMIKRQKVYYNENRIVDGFASATGIRDIMKRKQYADLRKVVPNSTYQILGQQVKKGKVILSLSKYEKEIIYTLRKMTVAQIADLPDVSEGLEYSIKKAADSCNTIYELINIVNSKRYTKTRLQRILLYALLNITKKDIQISKRSMPYIRILGFNEKGKYIVSQLSQNKRLNLITSVKKFTDKNTNKNLQLMLQKDINATNTYTLGFENDSWSNLDYTQKIITI